MEVAKSRQRETRTVADRRCCRPWFAHPGRDLRQRFVRLADNEHRHTAKAVTTDDFDRLPATRMKRVVDRRYATRIMGSMGLDRPGSAKRIWP